MPEPFKNFFSKEFVKDLATHLHNEHNAFNKRKFINKVLNEHWENRELKDRMAYVAETIHEFLTPDYTVNIKIVKNVSHHFKGLVHMTFPTYVELFGIDHYEESIKALEYFTKFSSSEFAVRPFIIKYPKKMMKQMLIWAKSDNEHERRLSSEGCRPRLPWAMALPLFKKDPAEILPILEKLKTDRSEYVRRSVANNLNDISKDHPDIVIAIAKKWLGQNQNTDKLVKHACRTLLKQGNNKVLRLFGYKAPTHIILKEVSVNPEVKLGGILTFGFTLKTKEKNLGKLRIEYGVDYVKKNGTLSRKVYKISESDFTGNEKKVKKNISFKPITTRVFHKGKHWVAIIINGVELKKLSFNLT